MLPPEVILEIQRYAAGNRKEICGIVANNFKVYNIRNVARDPAHSFIFDKAHYIETLLRIESEDAQVLCIYHSHPHGKASPSNADLAMANKLKCNLLIVAPDGYRWIEYVS